MFMWATHCFFGKGIFPLTAARAEPSQGLWPKAAAYIEQPRDQMSVLAETVQLDGTSKSSGALKYCVPIHDKMYNHSTLI